MGTFSAFLDDKECSLYGVEPAGRNLDIIGEHAATITHGTPGVLHGFKSYMLQDENGEPSPVYSVASGLDYPSVGPEHSMLHDRKRVSYTSVTDDETIDAFYELSRLEGIIPALESAHAVAYALKLAKEKPNQSILINLSGRGDKDIDFVVDTFGLPEDTAPIKKEPVTPVEAPKVEEVKVEASVVEVKVEADVDILDFVAEPKEEAPVVEEIKVEVKEEIVESSNQVVADRFNNNGGTVGEKTQGVADIRKAINITDRFLYLKVLFNNNQDTFNDALDSVNASTSLEGAIDYLSRFNWEDNETSEQFLKLVMRRFA